MNEREFWLQFRRGLTYMVGAINGPAPGTDQREFWVQLRRGLLVMVTAIEERWDIPRATTTRVSAASLVERIAR